jgi:L-arabinose isomerase
MATIGSRRPKVGLLALTLELYETLAPGLRGGREQWLRREVLPALAPVADVVFEGAVCRRQDVDQAVRRLESSGADALLVMLLTYSPSQIALAALKRTPLPIVVWNTQELFAVDSSFDSPAMTDNHGVHGTQDLCNVLLRSGVRFSYVTSHLRDAAGLDALGQSFAAAAAVGRLRNARLGLLGYPFPGMGDFALDTTQMVATLGCEWVALSLEDYILRAAAADGAEVGALVADYRASYEVAADVTGEDLQATARVEIALRGMVREQGLDALSYQFMAFGQDERTPTVPFVGASRLMAEGVGFGGEGDLISAAGTAFLNWLQPPASFAEMFTIDFGGNSVLMSHMGEANVAMARAGQKVRLAVRPSAITRTRGRQLALVTTFQPGPATLCALTIGPGGRWRLIAASMTIADFGPLTALPVPHFKLMPQGDVRDFLTAYAQAGGPHHCAVCFGDARAKLKAAAAMLDADYREV